MSMDNNRPSNDTNDVWVGSTEISLSRTVRFWFLLLFDISSVICTSIIVFYVVTDRKVRSSMKNHSLIATLMLGFIIQIIDVPLYLNFIKNSTVIPRNPLLCQIWWFVDYGMFNGEIILMMWISFERHILVYHHQLVATRKKRILFHYAPLIVVLLYIFIFYIYAIFYFPCENTYNYDLPACGATPCYTIDPIMGMFDLLANSSISSFLEILFSLLFLARFIWHRLHSNLPIQWRKQRKMTIQLMSISLLNLVTLIPSNIIFIAHLCGLPQNVGVDVVQHFFFFSYIIPFLFPIICVASMSGMREKIHQLIVRLQLERLHVNIRTQS